MRVVVVCVVPPRRCTAIRRESDSVFASRIQLCCCRVPFSHRFDFFVLPRNNETVEIIFCAVALRRKIFYYFFHLSKDREIHAVEWE